MKTLQLSIITILSIMVFASTNIVFAHSMPVTLTQSPLKQFKSGIAANDVKCNQDLQLIIKSEDGSPACVKSQTTQKLVERGWGWAMQATDSLKLLLPNRIIGLENDTGIVTLGNQTYYFETPNYTNTAYTNPVQISFHDVVFTLFPPGFRGGLPTGTGCEGAITGILAGSGSYYWTDVKFPDSIHELLHIFAYSKLSCRVNSIPTYFSTHTNPQAGLTFYDGKMKLLVGMQDKMQQNVTNAVITEGQNTTSAFTINSAGGPILLSPTCPICTPEYFNETTTYTGNVGKIIPGYPVFIKISDPYSMSPRTDQISTHDILPNGTFHYTINVTGKFGINQYTLIFIYGNQSITETLPVLPP